MGSSYLLEPRYDSGSIFYGFPKNGEVSGILLPSRISFPQGCNPLTLELLFVRSGFRTQAVPEEPLREFFPEDSQEAWALSLREFFSPGSSLTIVGGGWITVLP